MYVYQLVNNIFRNFSDFANVKCNLNAQSFQRYE